MVVLLLAGTAFAMVLLVLFSHYLFEENRTRVSRVRRAPDLRVDEAAAERRDGVEWRTLVDPVEAANRARASQPFAAAYSRAMANARDDRAA